MSGFERGGLGAILLKHTHNRLSKLKTAVKRLLIPTVNYHICKSKLKITWLSPSPHTSFGQHTHTHTHTQINSKSRPFPIPCLVFPPFSPLHPTSHFSQTTRVRSPILDHVVRSRSRRQSNPFAHNIPSLLFKCISRQI